MAKIITKSNKIIKWRHPIQALFLFVWMSPFSFLGVCGPVFHCYACPLSTFACPVGLIANSSAMHIFPFVALGSLVLFATILGGFICGWMCPFGFVQDLFAKIPLPKFKLPKWSKYARYAVLLLLVIIIPYLYTAKHPLFICRVCPVGALESGGTWLGEQNPQLDDNDHTGQTYSTGVAEALYISVSGKNFKGQTVEDLKWTGMTKIILVIAFFGLMPFYHRPWCKVCPLGAFFGLFNRVSFLHLNLNKEACIDCKLCHKKCDLNITPDKDPDDTSCIRCLKCAECPTGALHTGCVALKQDDEDK
ncbi:MAG: 4Fe-4S binding protein [Phycisphaerae bacterium]|nr:4Fe-4S binding protein [Phycisphaerae bacterium]